MLCPQTKITSHDSAIMQAIKRLEKATQSILAQGFDILHITIDPLSCISVVVYTNAQCQHWIAQGKAVCYASGKGWRRYQFKQDGCRIIFETRLTTHH
jgi:hypothetical protein